MLEMHVTLLTIGFENRLEPASKVLKSDLNSSLRVHLTHTLISATASCLVLHRE